MILYFSGTGNSRLAAQIIAKGTGDEVRSINAHLKAGIRQTITSECPLVIVSPVYSWRLPRVVEKFLRETELQGCQQAYFVLTCGNDTGNAARYAQKLCMEKEWQFCGLTSVVMPENYIAMFRAPEESEANIILERAAPVIKKAAEYIKQRKPFPPEKPGAAGNLKSGIVNTLFYRIFISAKGFRCTEKCIGCGKCADRCPLNNIRMEEDGPVWGMECTHCMACICGCPAEAVEYRNKTAGKRRYYCEAGEE